MFCNLNFEMKYLTLVSSALSTGIIVDTIWPLSTGYNSWHYSTLVNGI